MSRRGLIINGTKLMKRTFLFLLAFATLTIGLQPTPASAKSPKHSVKKSSAQKATSSEIARDAHGWSYVNGEWVHPDGYKFVRNQVLRTTAKAGKTAPEPPGKLALENAQHLAPKTVPAQERTQTEAERKAEEKRKNLEVRPAPQTGTHI
jgi:hypothetical protein